MLVDAFQGAVRDGHARMEAVFQRCRHEALMRLAHGGTALENLRPWRRHRLAHAELHVACTVRRHPDGRVHALRLLGRRRGREVVHRLRVELHGEDCEEVRVYFDDLPLPTDGMR
ncbi:hypothetical protein MNO14_01665 [Luteimonas sp. S4-F44]|uniref:hypothetical protein n=1 Tax=Luteimonas sp. S4-F44 TaxID=2925842 RepID=UPI001F53010B|nr:hypothetical protein [Luteimonas sp. S4-F44]UNK42842.1 hypothetical protein MNO14_01665 [Luteimonas sp. S4-F44]